MRLIRRLRNRFCAKGVVLAYHRVARLPGDPQLLAVTPEHFAEHLAVLRRDYHPMPLAGLARSSAQRSLAEGSAAVTFDDGYEDNLHAAKPILERHGVPATVFVAAGALESRTEFWWDDLERLALLGGLPEELRLTVAGKPRSWVLGAAGRCGEEYLERHRGWNALSPPPTPRHRLYLELHACLRPLPPTERRRVLAELGALAGVRPGVRPTHRPLSRPELVELSKGPLIEIGSHTVTHPVLSSLPADRQREDIVQGKALLEEALGRKVESFSYPYGTRSDYTAETAGIVRAAGFVRACAVAEDVVRPGADLFRLPRLVVRDWDGEGFSRRMREWLRG